MKTQKKNSLLIFVRSSTITLMNRLANVLTEGTLTETSGVFYHRKAQGTMPAKHFYN